MEYKELVKHHKQVIKDQNDNKWEVIETSDLEEICEAYHQHKLKLLGIGNVVGQSEQCSGCEESTGETKLWCCNHCGKRVEDF